VAAEVNPLQVQFQDLLEDLAVDPVVLLAQAQVDRQADREYPGKVMLVDHR
jgi:hypothetical protein